MWIFYLRVILFSRPSVVSCSVTLQPQCLQYFCSHPEHAQDWFEGSCCRGNVCLGRNVCFPNKLLSLVLRLLNNYFLSHLPTHTPSTHSSIPAWIYFLWKRERLSRTKNIALEIGTFAVRTKEIVMAFQYLVLRKILSFAEMELLWLIVPLFPSVGKPSASGTHPA